MKWHQVISWAAVIILAILLWRGCHNVVPRETITVKQLIHDTVVNNQAVKAQADSFTRELSKRDDTYNLMYKDYTILLNENEILQRPTPVSEPVPDTCQALNKAWERKYSLFAKQTAATNAGANRTIQSLQGTVSTQKAFISAKDTALSKVSKSLADFIAGYKQSAKDGPRNEINAR
jgi:hypothetical protein